MPMRRSLKNVVYNFTDAQVKVREATSNDPWGPSSTLMSEIADLTYNVVAFTEIMQMIWKRLNDHGKNWRHVYKALVLLDYLIKTGSEKVAQQCKENIFAIQTLKDFQHIEDNKDQGMNVREKTKQLVSLLKDDERLRNERAKALKAKERLAQNIGGKPGRGSPIPEGSESLGGAAGGYSDLESPLSKDAPATELESVRPSSLGEEELQLQLALAMSKEEHDEEVRKSKNDELRLQLAIDESRKHVDETPTGSRPPLVELLSENKKTDPWAAPSQPKQQPASDQWGIPPPSQPPKQSSDPWGSPAKQTSQPPVTTDPWGAPLAAPQRTSPHSYPSTPASQPDPWGASGAQPPPSQPSPWGNSSVPTQNQETSSFDTFTPTPVPTTNSNGNIDDAFDLISSRSAGSSPAKRNGEKIDNFDPLNEQNSSDLWNMDKMQQGLPQSQQKKKAEDFLGANAGLVNLDELVSKKTPSVSTNPFAPAPVNNPFGEQQQANSTRVPLSQIQTTSQTGFSQPVSGGLLPTPLVPMNNVAMQPQAQSQNYNPFL